MTNFNHRELVTPSRSLFRLHLFHLVVEGICVEILPSLKRLNKQLHPSKKNQYHGMSTARFFRGSMVPHINSPISVVLNTYFGSIHLGCLLVEKVKVKQ